MAERPRKVSVPNPFYVALLLVSTAFVVTVFGYLIGPVVQEQAATRPAGGPGPGSRALADWLDRRGPAALGVEFAAMLVFAILAMATDHWFSPRRAPKVPQGKA